MSAARGIIKGFFASAWDATVDYINKFDPSLVRAIVLKIVRHGLTASAGVLEMHGYLADISVERWIAAAPFVAGLIWSWWDAYNVKRKIANAGMVGRAEMGKIQQKDEAVAALKDEVKS
jgi:hypothetical protein